MSGWSARIAAGPPEEEVGLDPYSIDPTLDAREDRLFVEDGERITSAGVTAGIDFALTLLTDLIGETEAQAIQLQLEYAPAPPFNVELPVSTRIASSPAPPSRNETPAKETSASFPSPP